MIEEIQSMNFKNMTLETMTTRLLDWALSSGIKLIIGTIIIVIGFKIINKLSKKFIDFAERRSLDMTLIKFIKSLINYSLKILLVLVVASGYWKLELSGLAAIVASAGVAIGLALQGSLSNFAGGVVLLLMRPFSVGDFIEISNLSGKVEHIKLFYTYLITPDNKEIMIPNGNIANSIIINYSMRDTRRVDVTLNVAYEENVLHVKKVLWDIINSNDLILKNPEAFVGISEHADNSVNFVVRVWTKTENYWDVHFYILEQAKIKFDEENISIPYPQMDIHMKQ